MARYDLTDFEWSANEPLLPRKSRGVPRVDDGRKSCQSMAGRSAGSPGSRA